MNSRIRSRDNAYVGYFHYCVNYALCDQKLLFDHDEKVELNALLKLTPFSQWLISKLLLRRGEWQKTVDIVGAVEKWAQSIDGYDNDLKCSMEELLHSNFIEVFSDNDCWENSWNILCESLVVSELKNIQTTILQTKFKG